MEKRVKIEDKLSDLSENERKLFALLKKAHKKGLLIKEKDILG